ncbi:MAG: 2-phospho-L-lactate guanylyltransferase [Deltaproteobacteria bacterium]|nr:2-phospho-L-lactate guanylyltransferase [Deltaproteobacteria bacterium]
MHVALVPAKPLSLAKTRLGTLLSDADRVAVTYAMFADVLAALVATTRLDRVLVVTADERLAAHARTIGAGVVDEGVPRGLNGAVALATDAALRQGASTVVVVLSDVPLLRAADVDELLARTPRPGVALVPSKEGTGTNAIVRSPGGVVPPCFGGRSLERHVTAAERHHVACRIWRNVRIGFDVDVPDDLAAFASTESATATYREAMRLGVVPFRPSA